MSTDRLTMGSLFSGIGGFDLGFERAGFQIRWQVEIDPFCRAVLAQHWPDVRRYDDVRYVGSDLAAVDVICGGFPCQPHSLAGRRDGAADERDLWPDFLRLIRELRPRWIVAENVPGILSTDAGRFFGTVVGNLAACGYDTEWQSLPASAFGAPHQRDRVWIVAYSNLRSVRHEQQRIERGTAEYGQAVAEPDGGAADVADPHGCEQRRRLKSERRSDQRDADATGHGAERAVVADADDWGCESLWQSEHGAEQGASWGESDGRRERRRWPGPTVVNAHGTGREHAGEGDAGPRIFREGQRIDPALASAGWWNAEPAMGELVDGVSGELVRFTGRVSCGTPNRVQKLKGLGNAIVPQIAEWIAYRIQEAEMTGRP